MTRHRLGFLALVLLVISGTIILINHSSPTHGSDNPGNLQWYVDEYTSGVGLRLAMMFFVARLVFAIGFVVPTLAITCWVRDLRPKEDDWVGRLIKAYWLRGMWWRRVIAKSYTALPKLTNRIIERRGGTALRLHTLLVFCFLYAPIIVLVIFSFNDSRLNAAWRGFTLAWYGRLFANESVLAAFKNTMIVAVVSTAISTAIGTVTAYGLNRFHVRMRSFFDSLIYMPIIMPEIIMGISLLAFLVLIGVRLGLSTIIIGHVVFNISFVTVVVSARLADMDRCIEEAAMDLGADRTQTFLRVVLPMIRPGILAGALLAFTLSFDDFVITFFISGVGATTLPLKIYSMIKFGVNPEINAISTLVILASTIIVFASQRVGREG